MHPENSPETSSSMPRSQTMANSFNPQNLAGFGESPIAEEEVDFLRLILSGLYKQALATKVWLNKN